MVGIINNNSNNNDRPITYLQIKTHQLAGYFLQLEREIVSDYDLGKRLIPKIIRINFQNTYYNDLGTNPDSKVTDNRQVIYEYNSGVIRETRLYGDNKSTFDPNGTTGMVDIPSFSIIFYNLETKIREILRINKILDQRKIAKKTTDKNLSNSDRILLKRNDEHLSKLRKTYIKELVGICKEHLFHLDNHYENKEDNTDRKISTEDLLL